MDALAVCDEVYVVVNKTCGRLYLVRNDEVVPDEILPETEEGLVVDERAS